MRILIIFVLLLGSPAVFAQQAAQPAKPDAPPSQSFTIGGAIERPRTLTLAELSREPQATETVFLHTGHGPVSATFTGVPLWTLLDEAGVKLDAAHRNDLIRHWIMVTGSDGYSAVLSLAEVAPEFGGDQAIIAYQQDGKPIAGANGFARLIVPGDKAAGRAVGGIVSIEVK